MYLSYKKEDLEMANKSRKHRARRKFTIPVAVVAGFLPGATASIADFQTYGMKGATTMISRRYIGFDPQSGKFAPSLMWGGTFPLILGLIVHKVAGIMGVNRALSNAGIPFVRI